MLSAPFGRALPLVFEDIEGRDYYEYLGVERLAGDSEIKGAYRRLMIQNHPDRGGDEAVAKNINLAYEVLSDGDKRTTYDQWLNARKPVAKSAAQRREEMLASIAAQVAKMVREQGVYNARKFLDSGLNARDLDQLINDFALGEKMGRESGWPERLALALGSVQILRERANESREAIIVLLRLERSLVLALADAEKVEDRQFYKHLYDSLMGSVGAKPKPNYFAPVTTACEAVLRYQDAAAGFPEPGPNKMDIRL